MCPNPDSQKNNILESMEFFPFLRYLFPSFCKTAIAMNTFRFQKEIDAPAERVYRAMLGLDRIDTYEQWTSAFNSTSTYEGSWNKGSKIRFLGTDENGKRGGMLAEIIENVPNRFVSIRHYGIVDGEREITTGQDIEKWAGSLENYSFEEKDGRTTVMVEMDSTEEMHDYFNATWPRALDQLKALVE